MNGSAEQFRKGYGGSLAIVVLATLLLCLTACQSLVETPHTISTPSFPSGPSSGKAGQSLVFSTGGSTCSQGHPVQYRFDWGDGTYSTWSSSTSASKTWSAVGTYQVRTQARCSWNMSVISSWSSSKIVSISASSKLQILDWQLLPYDNMFMPWVVTGHAKNVSGGSLSYAEVRAQFYDSGDVLLTSWLDNINDLPANVIWEFNIYCMDSKLADRVDHATVTVGSCW